MVNLVILMPPRTRLLGNTPLAVLMPSSQSRNTATFPEQEHCYSVSFACGVSVFLSDEEISEADNYILLLPTGNVPSAGEFESVAFDYESESGFILRSEDGARFKAEEWRNGDIVNHAYFGSFHDADRWVLCEIPQHMAWREAHGYPLSCGSTIHTLGAQPCH